MSFRVIGLPAATFQHLYGLSEDALAELGVQRHIADSRSTLPDRIALRDAKIGESLLLLNYTHQPADTPYRASHAIFVLEGEMSTYDRRNEIPEVLRSRLLSLRAFNDHHEIIDADVVNGSEIETAIDRFFDNSSVAYLQAHYAKYGCYAALIERV